MLTNRQSCTLNRLGINRHQRVGHRSPWRNCNMAWSNGKRNVESFLRIASCLSHGVLSVCMQGCMSQGIRATRPGRAMHSKRASCSTQACALRLPLAPLMELYAVPHVCMQYRMCYVCTSKYECTYVHVCMYVLRYDRCGQYEQLAYIYSVHTEPTVA